MKARLISALILAVLAGLSASPAAWTAEVLLTGSHYNPQVWLPRVIAPTRFSDYRGSVVVAVSNGSSDLQALPRMRAATAEWKIMLKLIATFTVVAITLTAPARAEVVRMLCEIPVTTGTRAGETLTEIYDIDFARRSVTVPPNQWGPGSTFPNAEITEDYVRWWLTWPKVPVWEAINRTTGEFQNGYGHHGSCKPSKGKVF